MRNSRTPRRPTSRKRVPALLLAWSVLATLTVSGVVGAEEAPAANGVIRVGTLDRIPADARAVLGDGIVNPGFLDPVGSPTRAASTAGDRTGTLLFLSEAQQLWQIFAYLENNQARTAIVVRDPGTLVIKHAFRLRGGLGHLKRAGASGGGGSWMHAVKGAERVFLVSDFDRTVISIDLRTFEVSEHAPPVNTRVNALGGMSYDPFGDRVLLVFTPVSSSAVANATTYLYQMHPSTGAFEGPRPFRSCNGPLPSTERNKTYGFAPYIPNERFAYMPCQRSGYSGAVIRIPRAALMDPNSAEDIAVGPVNLEAVLVDHGSGRLFLTTFQGEVWAFDVETMAFVGVVGANIDGARSTEIGYGVDPASGRVFFQSPTFGLGIVEGRFFPIPQAKAARTLAANGQEELILEPRTNKLFVLEGASTSKTHSYKIYRVPPAPVPPPPADPDRNTVDQPEAKGVTEARYNASASGYGVRALLANGVATIVPAPAVGDLAPTAQVLAQNLRSPCGFTDREFVAARVMKTQADTGSTAAEAIAVQVDPRTQVDLDQPSRCDVKGKDTNGSEVFKGIFNTAPAAAPLVNNGSSDPRWHHDSAVCSSSDGDREPSSDRGNHYGGPDLGPSDVNCPLPGGKVTGHAETKLEGVISVGKTIADTSITRDGDGVHAVSKSIASDIEIGDGIHIDEIRSVATSDANGRPRGKGRMSSHTVTINGVSVLGDTICGVCNPTEVVDLLNRALAGRAQFRMGVGAADDRLVAGTPQGALTAVQKSIERQVSDQSLVGDFTTEIAALELVVFNDNNQWGRARQLYQFAGVSTAATYNIIGVPKDIEFDDGDDGGDVVGDIVDEVEVGGPIEDMPITLDPQEISDDSSGGIVGGITRAVRAVARGVRLFFSSPRHAMLLLTGWGLFVLPAVVYRRRLMLAALD